MTDYICPVAVCNEQGGEVGVKERKYVSVQANQDKATDEKKKIPKNERRAATKSYVRVIDFVKPRDKNKDSGFSKCSTTLKCCEVRERNKLIANRKLHIMQCDAHLGTFT